VCDVLIVEAAPSMGGSVTSIEIVIRTGAARGYRFGVMSQLDTITSVPSAHCHHRLPGGEPSVKLMLKQYMAVLQCLRRYPYKVVILNNLLSDNVPALLAALQSGCPVVQFARAYERRSRSWRLLSPRVSQFVAVSRSVQERLLSLGVPADRLTLAYEGIAVRSIRTPLEKAATRMLLSLSDEALVIGFVGRLVQWKGYRLFVEAMKDLIARDKRFHAVIVGGASDETTEEVLSLKQDLHDSGVAEHFHWMGEVPPEQVYPLMKGFDLFVHSSLTPEPFGRVLLEAMAVGVPVLSSAEGGPREILVDKESGLLTPPGDARGICEAVLWLFAKAGRAEQLGQAGWARAKEAFPEDVCAGPVLDVLDSLV
jgi:glycosyltransferase involved in cell wall biosynthesis